MPLLILSFVSFLISLFAVLLIKQRLGQQLLDIPNQRSSHTQPTPRGGGVGFILAFAITSGVAASIGISVPLQLWLVLIPLTVVGILDDRFGVSAAIRYLVQLTCASIAVISFGVFAFPWLDSWGIGGQILAIALTLIGFTALVNFYNFMDGLDGLVAGTTTVQFGFLAIYLSQPYLWLLIAALLGFLWWNWSPAKIFMGDAGSTVLGATIAIAILNGSSNGAIAFSALAITLPLVGDAVYTLFRRLIRGENIFQAHRFHLYQRLQQSGLSHARVAGIYIILNLISAIAIYFLGAMGAWLSLIGILAAISGGEYFQLQPPKNASVDA